MALPIDPLCLARKNTISNLKQPIFVLEIKIDYKTLNNLLKRSYIYFLNTYTAQYKPITVIVNRSSISFGFQL